MARKKTSNSKSFVKTQISARLRQIRLELFGEHGGPELARRLELPARTWYNYETGVTVPAEVMLSFIDQTGVNPAWLLDGEGQVYRENRSGSGSSFESSPLQMIRRGLEQLEIQARVHERDKESGEEGFGDLGQSSGFVKLPFIEMTELPNYGITKLAQRDHFLVYGRWLSNPLDSICLKVRDSAMAPILPEDSVAVVDLTENKPETLNGRMVVALDNRDEPVIRWLEVSGDHYILRAEQSGRQFPMIPYTITESQGRILGTVIALNTRFSS